MLLSDSPYLNHPRFRACRYEGIESAPDRIALARYMLHGTVMPAFLRAVVAHDFNAAARMRPPIRFEPYMLFMSDMPGPAHGSYAAVVEWEIIGGLNGVIRINEQLGRTTYA